MNIAFFKSAISNSGGMERVSIFLANELAKDKRNKVYYVSRVSGKSFFPLSKNIRLITLTHKTEENLYWNWPKYVLKVFQIVRKYRIEKWIDVGSNMSLITVPAKFFIKFDLITWEHFNLTYVWNPLTTGLSRWLSCHYAKNVVVLTQTDKERFEAKYHTGNIQCIPNPITISKVDSSISKEKIVLAIGRLSYQKGYDMMLDIWKMTRCKDNGWKLVIIGGGELKDVLSSTITNLGLDETVSLVEPTNDVEQWYARASIYLMTSRWEGLPLVLIEAVSAGLPVISFDCETGPRDIVKDGYNGFLIECFNESLLITKIDKLCDDKDLRAYFSHNSMIKSLDFSMEKIINNWNDLLS